MRFMQLLNQNFDLDKFYDDLGRARRPALLLDYDGTLSPFQIDRDQAFPYPGVREILESIVETGRTRVVIISGRRAEDLGRLLQLKNRPEIWGSHGNERIMPDGSHHLAKLSRAEIEGLKKAAIWARNEGLVDHMEGKPAGLAFHWRGLDDDLAATIRNKIVEKWTPILDEYGLKLLDFDGGIEIKVSSRDKGNAVKHIHAELGHDSVIAYLGDDLTDEDAFKAIGDNGLSVLVREQLRKTSADLWIKPPQGLLKFLVKWSQIRKPKD